jgi:hypothetical protein
MPFLMDCFRIDDPRNGEPIGRYQTKEAAFEAAVTAASLAVREGYRSNFQYPELESNLDGPDFHDLGAGGTKGDVSSLPSSHSSSLRQQ